jgi:hypothetical protein
MACRTVQLLPDGAGGDVAMKLRKALPLFSLCLLGAWSSMNGAVSVAHANEAREGEEHAEIRHVVLISVDGMHETDFANFIARHPLDDTHVAMLMSNPGLARRKVDRHVTTTQVAPTILRALELDPDALEGVRKEGTTALPNLRF